MAVELSSKDRFRKTIQVSVMLTHNLEAYARVVEGEQENGDHTKWTALVEELIELFPDADCNALAEELVTEACRTAYLKLKQDEKARNFAHGK